MNGLHLIRKQCNYSCKDIADILGVSEQVILDWESGSESMALDRLKKLSEYLGLDEKYLGEINANQREEILDKPIFRNDKTGKSKYTLTMDEIKDGELITVRYCPIERDLSLDEEYAETREQLNDHIKDIEAVVFQEKLADSKSTMLRVAKRNINMMQTMFDTYNAIWNKPVVEKMLYYQMMKETVDALKLAMDANGSEEKVTDNIDGWTLELAGLLKKRIETLKDTDDAIEINETAESGVYDSLDEALEHLYEIYTEMKDKYCSDEYCLSLRVKNGKFEV